MSNEAIDPPGEGPKSDSGGAVGGNFIPPTDSSSLVGYRAAKRLNDIWEHDHQISELMKSRLVAWRRMPDHERMKDPNGCVLFIWANEIAMRAAEAMIAEIGHLSATGYADLQSPDVIDGAVNKTFDYFAGRVIRETSRRPVRVVIGKVKWSDPETYNFTSFFKKLKRELVSEAMQLYPHRYSDIERRKNAEILALHAQLEAGMSPAEFLTQLQKVASREGSIFEVYFPEGEIASLPVRVGTHVDVEIPDANLDVYRRMISEGNGPSLGLYLADHVCKKPFEDVEGTLRLVRLNAVRRISDRLDPVVVGVAIPWLTLNVFLKIVEARVYRTLANLEASRPGRAKRFDRSEKIDKAEITEDIYAHAESHGLAKPEPFCWHAWTSRARKIASSYGLIPNWEPDQTRQTSGDASENQ